MRKILRVFFQDTGIIVTTIKKDANPELAKKSNVRDFATINELTVLSNLETHNADMIREGIVKEDRFKRLQQIAEYQLAILNEAEKVRALPD